ncbi:MAG: hypothetical protein U0528_09245 [Anaerolineae bacterium]
MRYRSTEYHNANGKVCGMAGADVLECRSLWSMDDLIPKIDAVNQFTEMSSANRFYLCRSAGGGRRSYREALRRYTRLGIGTGVRRRAQKWTVISSCRRQSYDPVIVPAGARSQRAVIFDDYAAAWDYTQQLLQQGSAQNAENKVCL